MSVLATRNVEVLPADQGRVTETGLKLRADLTLDEWTEVGKNLGRAVRASGWWIGDWINYGEGAGYVSREKYVLAEEITGLKRQTLWDYAWVARQFKSSIRIEDLPFKHHQTVASLPESKRKPLLEEAQRAGWSAAELRENTPATRPGSKKNHHKDVLAHAEALAKLAARWQREMTDALTPPQARKQLTQIRKAQDLLAEVAEAVEYRADTPHTFLGR